MKYIGWIVVQKSEGVRDSFYAEWPSPDGKRNRSETWYSPATAVEFFDKMAGEPVLLTETPIGAYRVYVKERDK